MIVDDEPDMRALLRLTLDFADKGLVVAAEAANGKEALESWRTDAPDVIVLDQQMPDLSGLEVAQEILRENPAQPIILFSAYLEPGTRAAASRLGVRECLPKDRIEEIPDLILRHCT
jgi:CheY-like chemotaxis protein